MTALVIVGALLVLVLLFAVARALFGPACAVLLCGGIGFCFAGPSGAGVGLVAGLVLAPITVVLGVMLTPED